MRYLTLDELKRHTRIDIDDEDELLEFYGASAEDAVLNAIGRDLENLVTTYGQVPDGVRHATMLLAAHYYTYRTPGSPTQTHAIPFALEMLLKPYMRLL